jgi:hypothetical protein
MANGGLNLDSSQWLAQQFSLDRAYTVTGVEGWMAAYVPGLVTLVLYTDQTSLPGRELFSSSFTVQDRPNAWNGIHGMSFQLDAGTYWAAFQVDDSSDMRGYMGGDALYQLGNYAYGRGNWLAQSNQGLGLRIDGEASAIPTASSTYLVLVALFALLAATSRSTNPPVTLVTTNASAS